MAYSVSAGHASSYSSYPPPSQMEVMVGYSGQQHLLTHTTTSAPPDLSKTAYVGYNYRNATLEDYEAYTDLLFHHSLFDEDTNLDTGQRHIDSTWSVSRSANVQGAGLTWIQYTFTDVPGALPPSTNDGTFVRYGALKMMWADFVKPSHVPHQAQENEQPWALPLSCTMTPMLSSSEYTDFTLTIFDPCRPNYKRVWTDADSDGQKNGVVSVVWDGLLHLNGDPAVSDYARSSDIFMTARLSFPPSAIAPASTITMENPDVALFVKEGSIGANFISEAIVEPGVQENYSVMVGTHNFHVEESTTDLLMGFHGKAFSTGYVPTNYFFTQHLLASTYGYTANFRYITGSRSQVPATDLGERRISLLATSRDSSTIFHLLIKHFDLDLLVRRSNNYKARITYYYIVYEINSEIGNIRDTGVQVDGTTYYFAASFIEKIRLQGTGKVHRLSTIQNSLKSAGSIPSANQQYIEYDPVSQTFSFVDLPKVSLQDGARYYRPAELIDDRSYYNLFGPSGNEGAEYRVRDVYCADPRYGNTIYAGINDFIDAARTHFPSSAPAAFLNDVITIEDQGPFNTGHSTESRARQIDVFLQAEGDPGLSGAEIDSYCGTCWARVQR